MTGYISLSMSITNCSWSVKAPAKKQITLTFVNLNMADDPDCQRERIEIRDGSDVNAPILLRVCGQLKPRPVTTSSNNVVINHVVFQKRYKSRLRILWISVGKEDKEGLFNTGT